MVGECQRGTSKRSYWVLAWCVWLSCNCDYSRLHSSRLVTEVSHVPTTIKLTQFEYVQFGNTSQDREEVPRAFIDYNYTVRAAYFISRDYFG